MRAQHMEEKAALALRAAKKAEADAKMTTEHARQAEARAREAEEVQMGCVLNHVSATISVIHGGSVGSSLGV